MDWADIKREDVKVADEDLAAVLAETVADYERRSGKVLQPAHIERLIINTFAYREHLTRKAVNEAYRQQHPRFATGLMLDLCGDDVNTPRLQARAARCTLRFTAVGVFRTVSVPVGTQAAAGQTVFETVEAAVLTPDSPFAEVGAVCTVKGGGGNGWAVGQIATLLTPVSGAEVKVSNISVPEGGADVESDEAYRQRILLAPESFSVAGPVGAYEYFARQVNPLICDVYVDNPNDTQGRPIGGQVRVTVLSENGIPGEELLTQVRNALSDERRRPLCDTVTVTAPEAVDYALNAELTLFDGADAAAVLAEAQAAWAAYEARRRKKLGADIVPLDIQTALKVAGVYNVTLRNLPLRAVASNQWARCTSVQITAASQRAEG